MEPNFVIKETKKDLNGKDISKEWNALFVDFKLKEIERKKKMQTGVYMVLGSLMYFTIVILERRNPQ